jgi:hypothetical protein
VEERFGIDRAGWKALVEAIYPNAEKADAIVMALSYCRARNLDPFKRPVHIVPMWSSVAGKMIETVWPGISELRTTAFRTGQYAGMSEPDFGAMIERTFKGKAGRGKSRGQERSITLLFPEWCRVTITRELNGKERSFVGPKVYWLEAYAPTPMCRTKCGRTVRSGSSKNAPRPERCAELSRKRLATRSPPRKWKVSTPSMARPMFWKSRSRKASRLRVPEGSASLSCRSCRSHSPSPHRKRPTCPKRSPPGKRAIPKSPCLHAHI